MPICWIAVRNEQKLPKLTLIICASQYVSRRIGEETAKHQKT